MDKEMLYLRKLNNGAFVRAYALINLEVTYALNYFNVSMSVLQNLTRHFQYTNFFAV